MLKTICALCCAVVLVAVATKAQAGERYDPCRCRPEQLVQQLSCSIRVAITGAARNSERVEIRVHGGRSGDQLLVRQAHMGTNYLSIPCEAAYAASVEVCVTSITSTSQILLAGRGLAIAVENVRSGAGVFNPTKPIWFRRST